MSSQIHLTPMEVKDLIRKYKSEMRKLDFQMLKIQSTITELEASLPEEDAVIATIQMVDAEGEVKQEATPAKKGRGRKPKTTAKAAPKAKATPKAEAKAAPKAEAKAAAKPKAKPAKKSKKTPTKGKRTRNTKLNEWDQMVMDGVRNAGKVLINSDLQDLGMAKIKEENLSMSEDELKTKLNQTLHKLANNKELLKKVKYSGRGFAYALPEWFTQKGDLPKKYQR